jgi:hypothetical protein
MDKHIQEAYDVSEGDNIRISTTKGKDLEVVVKTRTTNYLGGHDVTQEVEKFVIDSKKQGEFVYYIHRDYGSDYPKYSELMNNNVQITKENSSKHTYGYINELEKI